MKKILVVNTKYKTFGGEDSNIIDELDLVWENEAVEPSETSTISDPAGYKE